MEGVREDLLTHVKSRMLIGDGAMATQIYRLGAPVGQCYEEFNLTKDDVVAGIHRSYYEAGARLIETNTFGANRLGLARYGLENEVREINRAAVRLARSSVGKDAYITGTVGSIRGVRRQVLPASEAAEIYREQMSALLEEEPDAILLETFLDLEELSLALQVARALTTLPVMAQLSLIDLEVTRDGTPLGEAFLRLQEQGASVVGLNCRFGPNDMRRALAKSPIPEDAVLSVYPNAGLLSITDGKYDYPSEPAYFGAMAHELHALGVRILGGCCGTTPEHIREMARAVGHLAPIDWHQVKKERISVTSRREPIAARPDTEPSSYPLIHEKVKTDYTIIVELDPPKDLSKNKFMEGAEALHKAGADAITLADNSLAITRMSNLALGALMKQRGIEPLLHISARDRNLIGQQSHLMGLHALDIRQVLLVTGDPSRFGDLPGSTSVFEVNSLEMIRMVKQLNEGVAFSGKTLTERSHFVVGAAFNPHVLHFDKAIRRLERKVEAGADFIMTQPIYDPDFFGKLKEATKHLDVPIFVGIMPLISKRNAEFLHNEVPGITLTDETRERMAQYEGSRAREEGIAIAKELVDAAMEHFRGIYLITPLLRFEITVALTDYTRRQASAKAIVS